jgi:VanZ family protein
MSKKILAWLAVIAWMGVIYYFSSQPNLKSEFTPLWDFIFRKIAHMAEFFILTYLLFSAYQNHNLSIKKSVTLAILVAVLYAFFDEWHQSFVAGRAGAVNDVLIDTSGSIIFTVLKFFEKNR